MRRPWHVATALLCLAAANAGAGAAPHEQADVQSASRATVFLRVFADVELMPAGGFATPNGAGLREENVEISTGTGVVISSTGQALTCHHVIADGERSILVRGRPVKIMVRVRRIEALLPAAANDGAPARYEASVVAANADLDIALLALGGASFASADLGDSDALEPGDEVRAIGYPFGREVEIGRTTDPAREAEAPDASIAHGDFSAFRLDAQGNRRYLQTSALLNPGNSGGPLLDSEGYVVGIVSRRLSTEGAGLGFAVPINLVKEFLESGGLDGQLPTRRVALGPIQVYEQKGLRLRLPWGISDVSPLRLRVDSGNSAASQPVLHIDRVVSPWDALRLAEAITRGGGIEPLSPTGTPIQRTRVVGRRRSVLGRVAGTLPDGTPVRMEYAVLDLGDEKILARYVGPASLVAYNASIFRGSLASLEADAIRRSAAVSPRPTGWVAAASAGSASPVSGVPMPGGWLQEPGIAAPCPGLAAAAEAVSASPVADFTRSFRVSLLRQASMTAAGAAAACGMPAADGSDGYSRIDEILGARVFVRGRVVLIDEGELLQMEVAGPASMQASLEEWFDLWMTRLTAPARGVDGAQRDAPPSAASERATSTIVRIPNPVGPFGR
jgi:S1-C subfamily serine protease